ncbi:LANO_0C02234g1_1 [Lachancea nothofagi CBS 11611]|uniref:LANO_0C02234g1_1 n=1 Tax=Lachancea nothofagi CBS 11611 TaxID=1266666 RepID=A0A1G4J4R7_9SACH|nr:LANO_0C02234g1_1 [Lachancea nothofagi CBS 11611]
MPATQRHVPFVTGSLQNITMAKADRISSVSSSSSDRGDKNKKSRTRLSLVCRHCRRRKIKCDKKQPTCGNCAKIHAICIYDYQDQLQRKLSSQQPSTLHHQLDDLENKFEELRESLKARQLEEWSQGSNTRKNLIRVNFFDGLQPSCLESIFKCDYKPFSDMGMITKHIRLNPFLLFVTRSFKPLNYAVKKILQSVGDAIDPNSDELESVAQVLFLTPEVREILKKHTMNPEGLTVETSDAIRRCILQNGTQDNQKALFEPIDLQFYASKTTRAELIDHVVSILPSKGKIDKLVSYFMTVMYPLVPYINKNEFAQTISKTIQYSATGEVIGVNIGDHQDFARKIGCLAVLLVLLRISYTAMILDKKPFDEEITNRFIVIAQKCLAHLITLSHKTNEDILSCLILMRWSLLYFPTEGDVRADSITDMLMTLITNHAFKIGVYRDCIQATSCNKTEKRRRYFLHYRAKLWMGTLIFLRSDMCLRGNFPAVCVDYAHMTPKEDFPENYEDKAEFQIHRILHKQLEIFTKMSVLDKLSLQLHEGIDIDEIYCKIRRLEYELQVSCPLSEVHVLARDSTEQNVIQSMQNTLYFKVNVVSKIYFLAIRASILCNLEAQIIDSMGSSEHLLLRFKEVTTECFEAAVDLTEILQDYMSSAGTNQTSSVLADHRYTLNQLVQIGIFRVSYYFIGVILNILRAKEGLESFQWHNDRKRSLAAEIGYKVSIINSISKSIFQYVQKLVYLGSHTLSDTYFTSFKQFLFLEYAMQVIQNEVNPNTPSRLKEMLGETNIPACIDYSPDDWEKLSDYITKALGQQEHVPFFPPAEDLLATAVPAPLEQTFNPMLLLDDDINIQNMLDGDYTWADFSR